MHFSVCDSVERVIDPEENPKVNSNKGWDDHTMISDCLEKNAWPTVPCVAFEVEVPAQKSIAFCFFAQSCKSFAGFFLAANASSGALVDGSPFKSDLFVRDKSPSTAATTSICSALFNVSDMEAYLEHSLHCSEIRFCTRSMSMATKQRNREVRKHVISYN